MDEKPGASRGGLVAVLVGSNGLVHVGMYKALENNRVRNKYRQLFDLKRFPGVLLGVSIG